VRRSQAELCQINIPSGLTLSCRPLPSSHAHSAAAMVLRSDPGRISFPSSSPVFLEPAKLPSQSVNLPSPFSSNRWQRTSAAMPTDSGRQRRAWPPTPPILAVRGAHGRHDD
jgi:hypothetical protein